MRATDEKDGSLRSAGVKSKRRKGSSRGGFFNFVLIEEIVSRKKDLG